MKITTVSTKRRKDRRGPAGEPMIRAAVFAHLQSARAQGVSLTPAALQRKLVGEFGEGNVPLSVNTIRDLMEEILKLEPSEPWTLGGSEPDDIAIVVPIWAVALEMGIRLTEGQAAWIVRVRTAAPNLPPEDVWALARVYALEDDLTQDVRDAIDILIAFSAWRDAAHSERYFKAVKSGRIPAPPPLLWDLAGRAVQTRDEGPETFAFFEGPTVRAIAESSPSVIFVGGGEHLFWTRWNKLRGTHNATEGELQ